MAVVLAAVAAQQTYAAERAIGGGTSGSRVTLNADPSLCCTDSGAGCGATTTSVLSAWTAMQWSQPHPVADMAFDCGRTSFVCDVLCGAVSPGMTHSARAPKLF